MKKIAWLLLAVAICPVTVAQTYKTKNIIIVTIDGFRWQEVFQGASSSMLHSRYTKDKNIREQYWDNDEHRRREKLLPFFWNTIAREGQLYGNRNLGNEVNCANPYLCSYPGYSEILSGFIDTRIKTNKMIVNPNTTVLEYICQQPTFEKKVAAFATWEAFPFILREERSGIVVNAGEDMVPTGTSDREDFLNDLHHLISNPRGSRFDAFTFYYALEYLKREQPRVMFIGLDETDENGHGGRYDKYLRAAHNVDAMLANLWTWIQSEPAYRNQTTLIVTTDHGRGKYGRGWKHHGPTYEGSGDVWFAFLGPDTPALGEMRTRTTYYLNQLASTMASLLGLSYQPAERRSGEIIPPVFKPDFITRSGDNENREQ